MRTSLTYSYSVFFVPGAGIINDSQKSDGAQPRLLTYRHGQIRGNHIPRNSFISLINAIEIARYAAVTNKIDQRRHCWLACLKFMCNHHCRRSSET